MLAEIIFGMVIALWCVACLALAVAAQWHAKKALVLAKESAEQTRAAASHYVEAVEAMAHDRASLCVEIAALCTNYGDFEHDEKNNVLKFSEFAHLSKREH